jgi:hypothetical protein
MPIANWMTRLSRESPTRSRSNPSTPNTERTDMAKKQPPGEGDVSIGKFDILATYVYARGLIDGVKDEEAKQRGMVAAIMGAQAKLGIRKEHHEEFQAEKEAAEKNKTTTITAESFDTQVSRKMGKFFNDDFLLTLKKLVEAGLSYDEVKRIIKIPATWGAKISGEQFRERTSAYLKKRPAK